VTQDAGEGRGGFAAPFFWAVSFRLRLYEKKDILSVVLGKANIHNNEERKEK